MPPKFESQLIGGISLHGVSMVTGSGVLSVGGHVGCLSLVVCTIVEDGGLLYYREFIIHNHIEDVFKIIIMILMIQTYL